LFEGFNSVFQICHPLHEPFDLPHALVERNIEEKKQERLRGGFVKRRGYSGNIPREVCLKKPSKRVLSKGLFEALVIFPFFS
jgi:hypothetical protein